MAFDSTVRLKQINNPELSGFVSGIIGLYLPGATGNYTGLFYPYSGNPAGYIGTGVTGQFASVAATTVAINSVMPQILSYVALNYLSLSEYETGNGTSLQVTGSSFLTSANFSGINGTSVSISGNNILISSSGGGGSVSGIQSFVSGLPTGFGTSFQFIAFPNNFASIPRVSATLEVTSGVLYSWAINNRTISGFNLLLSNDIQETGVYLNVICSVI